jgi:hypothetical protein
LNELWTRNDLGALRQFAYANTPIGVMSLKLGRTEAAVRSKAQRERISLKPTNRSPLAAKRVPEGLIRWNIFRRL